MRRTLSAVLPILCAVASASAASFRFTATADSRGARSRFRQVLAQITARVTGEGVFHISAGDIDPVQDNYDDLVREFGRDVVWYPVVGNHEVKGRRGGRDMKWIRNHYRRLPHIVNGGPAGCETTTYSFDYEDAHFVVLNEYYDGRSDTGTNGDVVDALYKWLAADLAATKKPVKFVFGHEPAFPFRRHVGDSLDAHVVNRDRFWALLEREGVAAYFCGHTHYYQRYRSGGGEVWQIDLGNAGNDPGDGRTFADVTVGEKEVRFDVWRGTKGEFILKESWTSEFEAEEAKSEETAPEGVSITAPACSRRAV